MSIQRGNILLFKNPMHWYERLICRVTDGPYFHVALVIDATHVIEATPHGIATAPAPINPATFAAIDILSYTTQAGIERGLDWAARQYGKEYGWSDIAFQAIKFLWPNNPLRFGIEGHMDCSDYAVRYMREAGVMLPDDYDPYATTPNDLGRFFGLVAPRKGQHDG